MQGLPARGLGGTFACTAEALSSMIQGTCDLFSTLVFTVLPPCFSSYCASSLPRAKYHSDWLLQPVHDRHPMHIQQITLSAGLYQHAIMRILCCVLFVKHCAVRRPHLRDLSPTVHDVDRALHRLIKFSYHLFPLLPISSVPSEETYSP